MDEKTVRGLARAADLDLPEERLPLVAQQLGVWLDAANELSRKLAEAEHTTLVPITTFRLPAEDARVTARLKGAGAIIIGKTNMHEFAWGGTSANPHYGFVRNPWDPERFPAGSSGGSGAAVAARTCFGALGADTGGSIRLPSAVNGVTGIRPTIGRVSNPGVIPLAWSMDTVGTMARTASDCALTFN